MKRIKRFYYLLKSKKSNILLLRDKKYIKSLHNKHSGEKCFIVGNGPSLRIDDLEKLNNCVTFGSNRVYNIFDKTDWRPTYYCVQDYKLILKSHKEISDIDNSHKIVAILKDEAYHKIKNARFLRIFFEDFYPDLPKFSTNISNGIYEGYTVSYMCLQLAIYMGFKEIYLLGIDHSYSVTLLPNGEVKHNDSKKDHFSDSDKIDNIPQIFKSTLAYKAAKKYADENGIKIFNATRGGELDVFERVNFDELF